MIRRQRTFNSALPAGYDGQFHWDFLLPAWAPTKVEPMDIDGMVERFGAFLLFETKDCFDITTRFGLSRVLKVAEHESLLGRGQALALIELARRNKFTIILCQKREAQIDGFEVWAKGMRTVHEGDAQTLIAFCREWFQQQRDRSIYRPFE